MILNSISKRVVAKRVEVTGRHLLLNVKKKKTNLPAIGMDRKWSGQEVVSPSGDGEPVYSTLSGCCRSGDGTRVRLDGPMVLGNSELLCFKENPVIFRDY